MGEMITKPDANPVVLALMNLFVGGGLGYFLMGQKKKAIISWVIFTLGLIITCGGLSVLWQWISAYDAYLLGQKLQRGESVGENENGLSFLNAIFKD